MRNAVLSIAVLALGLQVAALQIHPGSSFEIASNQIEQIPFVTIDGQWEAIDNDSPNYSSITMSILLEVDKSRSEIHSLVVETPQVVLTGSVRITARKAYGSVIVTDKTDAQSPLELSPVSLDLMGNKVTLTFTLQTTIREQAAASVSSNYNQYDRTLTATLSTENRTVELNNPFIVRVGDRMLARTAHSKLAGRDLTHSLDVWLSARVYNWTVIPDQSQAMRSATVNVEPYLGSTSLSLACTRVTGNNLYLRFSRR
ncbi:hypothetical protein RI367_005887 [Sorochytrium milnesiophthora]